MAMPSQEMDTMKYTRTRVVCTIGPSSSSRDVLEEMKRCGMDVARINMSHGQHDTVQSTIRTIREIRGVDSLPRIALDTKGPEIRIVSDVPIEIVEGEAYRLSEPDGSGQIKMTLSDVSRIKKGMNVLIDDGKARLEVVSVADGVLCVARNSYTIKPKKAVNIPDIVMDESVPTEKDRSDILFGVENGVDYIFLSFVSRASEIRDVRQLIRENCRSMPLIYAKIENKSGIRHIDEIIDEADGIMVARGDMSVEVGLKHTFSAQKMVTRKCLVKKKPIIMATHMLESMTGSSTPTRAEISDVGNAVLDGCDAVMLSAETASGKHPVLAVQAMKTIVEDAEFFKYGRLQKDRKCLVVFMECYSSSIVDMKHLHSSMLVVASSSDEVLCNACCYAGLACFKMEHNESHEKAIDRIKKHYMLDECEWIVVGGGSSR